MTVNDLMACVVGASAQEFADVQHCLPDWRCVNVPVGDRGPTVSSISATPQLIVVYALKDEKATLAICEQLRNAPKTSGAPILLVITRYMISVGIAVKRLGNAEFIMSPFDEKRIREKIAGLADR